MRVKPERHADLYCDFDELGLRIVQSFPEFEPLFEDSLEEFGEFLFHPFMSRLTDIVVRMYLDTQRGDAAPGSLDRVRAIIDFFDGEAGKGAGARNEIAVGFVENLPYSDEPGSELRTMLGPNLSPFSQA